METQAEKARVLMQRTQESIVHAAQISIDDQNKLMFETAYEWLESIGVHGNDQTLITSTKQFWGFWRTEWHRLDMLFIDWFNEYSADLENKFMYEFIHGPKNKFLQGSITQAGYHQCIKTMTA